jgi:hypothetical protein
LHLLKYLGVNDEHAKIRSALEGGAAGQYKAHCREKRQIPKIIGPGLRFGDLEVLVSDIGIVERAYKEAVAVADNKWFVLDSSRQQLLLLRNLGFRPHEVDMAIKIFDEALAKLNRPKMRWKPRLVFLFSGHIVDAPGRAEPRFPDNKKNIDIASKEDGLAS